MIDNTQMRNSLIVTRLLLERCRCHIAHLNALLHLCEPGESGLDDIVADSARKLIAQLNTELTHGADTLEMIE